MSQALLREKVIFDLWSRKPISASSSSEDVQEVLARLYRRGYISNASNPTLTDKGLEFVMYGRDTNDMAGLLADIDVSREERAFLANIIQGMIDKPFVYGVIKAAAENPNKNRYPSVDLGAHDDVEHGLLFGARTHIMVDPLISKGTIDEVLQKLRDYGADVGAVNRMGDGNIRAVYNVGNTERELYLVGREAMAVGPHIKQMIETGMFALVMKGKGGIANGEFGSLLEAVEHYSTFLINNGLSLTGVPTKKPFERIGEGMLAFWAHISQDYRLSPHYLYANR